ncbi:uncharacterized protein LOC118014266 [Mirounga leonina]|uniref:uncharacterized protein LOC118014266 n=1 Tax=Mirounga leonina TaxID=9715 RepID=UPI00156BEBFB|nr:uncharacterized protein LOC118014266 [Mirounga leonina]
MKKDGPIRVSTAPALDAPEPSAAAAGRLESDSPPARPRAGPPGAPLDPSLTQADRFLLVFRVCFCLAPFEIGYDVGGQAAASKPRANRGEQAPVVSRRTDGQSGEGRSRAFFTNFFNCIYDALLQR